MRPGAGSSCHRQRAPSGLNRHGCERDDADRRDARPERIDEREPEPLDQDVLAAADDEGHAQAEGTQVGTGRPVLEDFRHDRIWLGRNER
jgi:hypothetical protein